MTTLPPRPAPSTIPRMTTPPPGFEAPLTRAEAAEALRLSLSSLDRLTASGELAAVRIGRKVLFLPSTIAGFLAGREGK